MSLTYHLDCHTFYGVFPFVGWLSFEFVLMVVIHVPMVHVALMQIKLMFGTLMTVVLMPVVPFSVVLMPV